MKPLLLCLLLAGCATPPEQRWLTKEEDAELRAKCEGQSCVILPGAVFQQLVERLRMLGV
jgi:hypothetical protein